MARSVKIDSLLENLEIVLPTLGKIDLPSNLADSECKIVAVLVSAITAFNSAELTAEDQTELSKFQDQLGKLDEKHDAILDGYYKEIAPQYAQIAKKHASDPVSLVAAMTDLEARKADKIGTFQVQRETDSAITNECILAIEQKKSIAGMDAAKAELKYTDKTQKTTSHKVGEAEYLVLDLLKSRPHHGQFYVVDRAVRFMPISKDWQGKKIGKMKIEIGEWYEIGQLADCKELQYQTALQRWAYDWVNRFSGTFAQNTERVNAVFTQGSAKAIGVNGQTGGTANVWRVVDEIAEGQGRQVTRADLEHPEKYALVLEDTDIEEEVDTD